MWAAMQSVPRPVPPAEFAPLLRPSSLQPSAGRRAPGTEIAIREPIDAPLVVLRPPTVIPEPAWHIRIDIRAWFRRGWGWRRDNNQRWQDAPPKRPGIA
jgi:hypothetical protein